MTLPLNDPALGLAQRVRFSDLSVNAAAVAYNAFLGLVPLTLALIGMAAVVGRDAAAVARVERALQPIAPDAVTEFITELMVDAGARVGGSSLWLIVVSALVTLFLGSRAVVTLQRTLATVEQRVEARPPLQLRLVGIALTVAGGISLMLASSLLVAGRHLFQFLAGLTGVEGLIDLWRWLRVPVAAVGLYLFLLAFYRWGPPRPLPKAWLAALVATGGVILGSLGFGLYLSLAPEMGATFGALGAVAVALVWLYVGAMAILVGGVVVAHLGSRVRHAA